MPGQSIEVGPWVGGLNTYSDDTSVADNEAVEILNFELDLDGSMVSRPPIVDIGIDFPLGATGNMELLGYFYDNGGVPYLIASDGLTSTYYFNGSAWVLLTATISATAMAQFNDKAWLLAPFGSANPGGYWTPAGSFVAEANMPKGEVLVAHKFRLWVARGKGATSNGTRLQFSKLLGTSPFWPTVPDFIDVGAGDGQEIVQLAEYYNSLLVFRTNSTYSFQYQSDPTSGVASKILPGVGLTDKRCLVANESSLYFLYDDDAYEFINNRAAKINEKVPFQAISRVGLYSPLSVSTFNQRIIYSYYDTMFVFSLKTRTWTKWRSTARGPIGRVIVLSGTNQTVAIVNGATAVPSGGTRVAPTYRITDAVTTDTENFQCSLQTKNYNYEAASRYKRLFWWGADAVFRGTVTAVVTPVTYNYTVTWGQLRAFTWGQVKNFTWAQPISGTLSVSTARNTVGSGASRKFVKFLKSLRFRQINFRVTFDTDGSSSTAPVRLFSMTTYVSAKETVVKAVS